MTAEQVLRAAIVKMLFGFTYQELAFHIVDSQSIRRFCQIGIADKGFKKSVLNKNIKALSERTWQAINQDLVDYAKDQKIEKGRQVRIDCTVVESNIHPPSDSSLLWDAVRVLTRLVAQSKKQLRSAATSLSRPSAPCKKAYGGDPVRQKQQTAKAIVQRSAEGNP